MTIKLKDRKQYLLIEGFTKRLKNDLLLNNELDLFIPEINDLKANVEISPIQSKILEDLEKKYINTNPRKNPQVLKKNNIKGK